MTAIGLCFGGGQISLGTVASILAVATLWILKWVEVRVPREHRAMLIIAASIDDAVPDLDALIGVAGYQARFVRFGRGRTADEKALEYEVRWMQPAISTAPQDLLEALQAAHEVDVFDMTVRPSRVK